MGQVRENNEDNLHLWTRDEFVLAVIADGMGGAVAGEEASRLAVEAVEDAMTLFDQSGSTAAETLADENILERMQDIINTANAKIVHRAMVNPDLRGMGTTVTMAFVRRAGREIHAMIAHVGDSRAYLIDGHNRIISQITADHSFVEALVAAGHLTHEQAEDHPMRNVLYRALGQNEDIEIDLYEARLHVKDRLVLCSDGLTRHVKPQEIADISLGYDDPETVAQTLIALANERGGEDNISVVVIIVEGDDTRNEDSTIELRKTVMGDEDTHVLPPREKPLSPDDTVKAPVVPTPRKKRRTGEMDGEGGGEGRDPSAPPQ
jgi:protein phosphatase